MFTIGNINTPVTMQNSILSKGAGQTIPVRPQINLKTGDTGENLPLISGDSEVKVLQKAIPTDFFKQVNLGDRIAMGKMKGQISNILGNVPSPPSTTTTVNGNQKQVSNSPAPSTVSFVPQVPGGTAQTASTYLAWSDTAIQQFPKDSSGGVGQIQYVIVTNRYTSS